MQYKEWQNRRMARSDLSQYLTHLTRENTDLGYESYEVLFKILQERKLIGSTTSTGFICGTTPAVCFQDAPLQSIGQNVWYEQVRIQPKEQKKFKFKTCGLI